MKTAALDFHLPPELIAQEPAARRDESRLLVVDRSNGKIEHAVFKDLPNFLPQPCRLFRNNATVFKARLRGRRDGGGAVECLLLEPGVEPGLFWCLLRPGKRLQPGKSFTLGLGEATCQVVNKNDEGEYLVKFLENDEVVDPLDVAERFGEMPLPPYIERGSGEDHRLQDLDPTRYQTVYADPQNRVAAAAPTAGLHFTPELFKQLEIGGSRFYDLTLHVGLGTFQPVSVDDLNDHHIHEEFYSIPSETVAALKPDASGGPRVMVGTTSVRSAEDFAKKNKSYEGGTWSTRADLFIRPPFDFQVTDHLITNFHLPRSTLLCLVASFLDPKDETGLEQLKAIYAEAIEQRYRFFSYGDAMLIL
ncbi:tRNA preQ1(34) S-adenosylmethionine ribosyltransferase-isomerase QueA [Rubellicoccus peritrichatus]|uniref:S-adenosylmethionine:tRNA ribosyltransferase-isomerase n=1 Tax=Rubellicoccus peritrichatus TaxID=3080537 RepID=A0AAQ3LD21_9BACT|nr:tRNA preQ1(34) S-adenosylmethionine ribosyltransferase-isomerase QueA [Puniceicoccus sp. CR14]WOO43241.1 tRNA preQ1(34) S-adenosylmethionine ribosyltransferase-isomerase QueA [Puniceicoccus sp. CR14]